MYLELPKKTIILLFFSAAKRRCSLSRFFSGVELNLGFFFSFPELVYDAERKFPAAAAAAAVLI